MTSMSEPATASPDARAGMRWIEIGVPATILALVIVGSLTSSNFLTVNNLMNVLTSVSIVGIVACGMMFVVISGCWADLSVPAIVATGAIVLLSTQPLLGTPMALVAAVIAGTGVGAINGVVIGYIRTNPVIVTLGSNVAILGIAQAIVGGKIVYNNDPVATAIVNGRFFGIPFVVLVFLAVSLIVHVVLAKTIWGRWSLATGGSYAASDASGVPVRFVRFGSFVLSGGLAAIAGCLLALSLQSVRPVVGLGYDFDALAAIVVGGVSLLGGSGSVARVIGGLLVVQLLSNVMVLQGFPTTAQGLAKGVVIIIAVAIDINLRQRMGRS